MGRYGNRLTAGPFTISSDYIVGAGAIDDLAQFAATSPHVLSEVPAAPRLTMLGLSGTGLALKALTLRNLLSR